MTVARVDIASRPFGAGGVYANATTITMDVLLCNTEFGD